MSVDYGMEIDALKKEMAELKELLHQLVCQGTQRKEGFKQKQQGMEDKRELNGTQQNSEDKSELTDTQQNGEHQKEDINSVEKLEKSTQNKVEIIKDMHPDFFMSGEMEEMCRKANEREVSGLVSYFGVFSSGGRQSNWISKDVDAENLLKLIENRAAERVLSCIGNNDRLNILLAILRKPSSVAEIVAECKLGSTGQAYHHMKPLLAVDLITEDTENAGKGIYIVRPEKVQGIIMLLAGIADMIDKNFTEDKWEK